MGDLSMRGMVYPLIILVSVKDQKRDIAQLGGAFCDAHADFGMRSHYPPFCICQA